LIRDNAVGSDEAYCKYSSNDSEFASDLNYLHFHGCAKHPSVDCVAIDRSLGQTPNNSAVNWTKSWMKLSEDYHCFSGYFYSNWSIVAGAGN
jgi:hypothetical protein